MPEISLKTKIKRLEQQIAKAKTAFKKVDAMLDLAELLKQSDSRHAFSLLDDALTISRQNSYDHGMAYALLLLAQFHDVLTGDHKKALPLAEESLAIFTKINSHVFKSRVIRAIGKIYIGLGEHQRAEEFLKKGKELAEELYDREGIASAELAIACLLDDMNRYDEAIERYKSALKLKRELGDATGQSIILNNLGGVYTSIGNFSKGLECHNQSLHLKDQLNDRHGIAASLNNIAGIYLAYGDYETGLSNLFKSLEIKREQGNTQGIANTLSNIGMVQTEIGDLHSALQSFTEALQLYSKLGQRRFIALAMNHIGVAKVRLGAYTQGMAWLKKALKIRIELQDDYGLASSYCNLGEAHRLKGDFPQAIHFGQLGADISRSLGDKERLAHHYTCLAENYAANSSYAEAFETAYQALALAREINDAKQQAAALKLLADTSEKKGDLQQSINYYRQFIEARQLLQEQQVRNKVQTLLIEFDVERIRHEAEINKLKSEQFEREIALKNKELTALALHLVNKNEFLKTIGEQISEDVTNTSEVIKNLSKIVQDGAGSETEWKLFEKQFLQVNPDFTTRLEESSGGSLSATELKICSLLRTGLNSQEVANVLFLSKRTVENHRYNIHRKLKLGEQKLVPYLMKV
ncbi:MAG TPA: tetratricopeptide repeat protein [Patescibacteria group bacterium]|nr:tetratricopeptide repeat protein [Patescibacteria group bacterium]